MKRMLLVLVSLLLLSSVAMADHIGVYSDAGGSSCYLGAPGVFSAMATVIHKFSEGATGSRFKVMFPAGTTFFAFNTSLVPVGSLPNDLSLGYGTCLSGSIVLGTILAIYSAGLVQVLPSDLFTDIIYTDCSFAELPASGGYATVGSQCDAGAIEASTWAGVKALYR
jgi:hypothetical protein